MLDESAFRQSFPLFADPNDFLPARVNFWLSYGKKMLREDRWEDLLDHGLSLFVAHFLVLEAREQEAADISGAASIGAVVGVETSKSIDKVSVSVDVASVTVEGGGHWNQTTFGVQFLQLSQMMGAGGIQL